jgi:transmembrane sensor
MNERFAILITRKLAGEASAEELRELELYVRSNPQSQFFTEILTTYWNTEKSLGNITKDDDHFNQIIQAASEQSTKDVKVFELNPAGDKNQYRRKFIKRLAAAAAVIGILLSASYVYMIQKKEMPAGASNNEVVVKKGNKYRLSLPDGSHIWLNSDSKLRYNLKFNGSTREVELEGEAYFDVVKDKTRPFIIHTKAMDIKVLGTAFNVKAYAEDKTTEASLIRGSIEASFKDRPNEKIILKPSEKIVFANSGRIQQQKSTPAGATTSTPYQPIITVTKITCGINKKDSLLYETGWVNNKLVFRSEAFEDLALRLQRWYNVKIDFKNDGIKQLKLTGTFENESINEVMNYLSSTAAFRYKINKDSIVISK